MTMGVITLAKRYWDVAKTYKRLYIDHRNQITSNRNWSKLTEKEYGYLHLIKKQGYAIVENYYDSTLCESLIGEIERILVEYRDRVKIDKHGSDHREWGADRVSDLIEEYSKDPWINKMASYYLGEKVETICTMANKTIPSKDNLGSGHGWHRDTPNEKQIKAIIYLTDTGPENGPFEYIIKSHHFSNFKDSILKIGIPFGEFRYSDEQVEQIVRMTNSPSIRVSGKAGSLILADTSGIHRGAPIESGQRYALSNYIFTPEACQKHEARGKFVNYYLDAKDSSPAGEYI